MIDKQNKMSSILVDASAVPVSNFTESFFFNPGYDKRLTSREFHVFHPSNAYSGSDNIQFSIPAWTNGNCFDMRNIFLDARVALKKTGGEYLTKDSDNAAPCNNVLNTMIRSVRLYLNDVLINKYSDNYHLKSYITQLYSYDTQHKEAFLRVGGW